VAGTAWYLLSGVTPHGLTSSAPCRPVVEWEPMRRVHVRLVLVAWLCTTGTAGSQEVDGKPGYPAPPEVVSEIRQTVDRALARFHAMDEAGLLAMVSPQYRTDTLTKAGIADQLRTIFTLHDRVRARVSVDDVRIVGDHAWVYSTGQVSGRLRVVGSWMLVASWQRELEIARREDGRWRLYGYQR
jgi:hypothetical protein